MPSNVRPGKALTVSMAVLASSRWKPTLPVALSGPTGAKETSEKCSPTKCGSQARAATSNWRRR